MTPKGHGVIKGRGDLLYDPTGQGQFDLVFYPKEVTGSLKVAVTYFMTPKVKMTFVVYLAYFMTPKGHTLDRRDLLYDPKGQVFDQVWQQFLTKFLTKVTVIFSIGLT